jgi:hypothetical protein
MVGSVSAKDGQSGISRNPSRVDRITGPDRCPKEYPASSRRARSFRRNGKSVTRLNPTNVNPPKSAARCEM